jgi:hypothetical protein
MTRIYTLLAFLLYSTSCIDITLCASIDHTAEAACNGSQDDDGYCQTPSIPEAVTTLDDKNWKDVLLFPDGGVYSGGVVDNQQEGIGREETAGGDRYEGEWEGGIKSGAGKYKWKDGRSYKGK